MGFSYTYRIKEIYPRLRKFKDFIVNNMDTVKLKRIS